MPKIDIDSAPTTNGTTYPEEYAGPCKPRRRWRLGDAAGLSQFGVNLLHLPDALALHGPGDWLRVLGGSCVAIALVSALETLFAANRLDTLAWILHLQGNSQEALPLMQRAVELEPDNAEFAEHLKAIQGS